MSHSGQIIIANWKMNGDSLLLQEWLNELSPTHHDIVLCPPFPLLPLVKEHIRQIHLGAQDCHFEDAGAFTGFTSPQLLKGVGCDYVILGHSERRAFEDDITVGKKAQAAHKTDLIPIICVGESLDVRKKGNHIDFVIGQIKTMLPLLIGDYVIAYEPLWAIGTGMLPSSGDIEELHTAIKTITAKKVLYGGSVKPDNAHAILRVKNVDGLLVGGASLNIEDFNLIIAP